MKIKHDYLLRIGGPIGMLVVLLVLWESYVNIFDVSQLILPKPTQIFESFQHGLSTGMYGRHLWVTAQEVFLGYLIGVSIGFLFGSLIALSRTVEILFYPYILALQTMPKVALAPLMTIWIGFGMESKIVITAIVSLFPVMVNVIVGLRTVDPVRLSLIQAMNGGTMDQFLYVRLPSAAPYVFAGLKTAVVMSLLGAVTAEFVGAEAGLGYLLIQLMNRLDTPGVFAVLILLSILGVTLYLIADWLHRKVVFWDKPSDAGVTIKRN